MASQESGSFRSGFVALVGRPNVGKSTLLNKLVGRKIAIMSKRPQTTRNVIRGVMNVEQAQVVFIDTPGLHKPKHRLGEYMVEAAIQTLGEVDVVLVVCDATDPKHPLDQLLIERLASLSTPVFLVINKVDAVEKPEILSMIADYREVFNFQEIIPVSAKTGTQVAELKDLIVARLPEGPKYYPDDMVTDHPEQFVAAEFIREKVLQLTREEIPHSVMVDIEEFARREKEQILYIRAVVYTERESQKGILIGKRGSMLKNVGQLARQEIEKLFGTKVYLDLWVKVKPDWRNEPSLLRRWGFDNN